MGLDDERDVRAWYGGGYSYDDTPSPPSGTATGGRAPVWTPTWATEVWPHTPATDQRPGEALVMGRFHPPHLGHARLLGEAAHLVEGAVNVVVAGEKTDAYPVRTRVADVRDLVPPRRCGVVLSALDVAPRGEPLNDDFWRPWVDWFRAQKLLGKVRHLVAADPNARRFAELIGLDFVLVERDRRFASGTAIRREPWRYWESMAPSARAHFTAMVALVGPEGAGKSTLGVRLADHFQTSLAQEYAPALLSFEKRELPTRDEFTNALWVGQRQAWADAKRRAQRFFFTDTEHLTLALWRQRLHGVPPPTLIHEAPQLTLLLDDATPWLGDEDRDEPAARLAMVEDFKRELALRGWPFQVISGPREERLAKAITAVEQWVATNPMGR